jgi:chorismate synthase
MAQITYQTAGESHGKGIIVIITGIPSGLAVDQGFIDNELARRQSGYGRGGRMKIETDRAEILTGVCDGMTIGSPVTLAVWNKDYENWKSKTVEKIHKPRPGHADLVGAYKYGLTDDIRNVLERSSARETAARVAAGALVKIFLARFGVSLFSHVVEWGGIKIDTSGMTPGEIRERAEESELRSAAGPDTEAKIKAMIDAYKKDGDTMGGVIETIVSPVPPMLGSYQTAGAKLDAKIAAAVMSVQAIKGIEFGAGFGLAGLPGNQAHDEIYLDDKTGEYYRKTNRSGGTEGGMSTGSPIVFRSVMKPIPTLMKPLDTVDISESRAAKAVTERSDVAAVAAAGVVIESVTAVVVADAILERYGCDNMDMILRNFNADPDLKRFRWKERTR